MWFRDFLLLFMLLVQTSYGDLNCAISQWKLKTLECYAIGKRGNYIHDIAKESDLADTTTTGTFRKFDWTEINTFEVKSAKLLKFTPNLFENASALVNLDLSENPDLCFSGREFVHLKKLRILRLSGTGKCGKQSLFSELQHLHSLDLSNVRILSDVFPLGNLISFPRLKLLDISRNHNFEIDFTKFNIGGVVESIDTSQTKVKVGDRCFTDAVSLRTLIMSGSRIRSIPKHSFEGTAIRYLDISSNTLSASALDSLTESMIHVNISHNKIENVFKPGIFKQSLEILDLSFNKLEHIHAHSFLNTSKLKTLILSHNKLEWLYVALLADLTTLNFLDLSHNLLHKIEESSFDNLESLKTLNLAGNIFATLNNNMFKKNENLENLYLQDNNIETLNILTFVPLKRLKILDLRNNKLNRLPEDFFSVLNLDTFLISCNRMTYLSDSFFKGKPGTVVSLHGNPWKCSCLPPIIDSLERYELKVDKGYFNEGNYPICYIGENNDTKHCNDNTLLPADYANWETAIANTGIKC